MFLLKIGDLKQQQILLYHSAYEWGIEGCFRLSTLMRLHQNAGQSMYTSVGCRGMMAWWLYLPSDKSVPLKHGWGGKADEKVDSQWDGMLLTQETGRPASWIPRLTQPFMCMVFWMSCISSRLRYLTIGSQLVALFGRGYGTFRRKSLAGGSMLFHELWGFMIWPYFLISVSWVWMKCDFSAS